MIETTGLLAALKPGFTTISPDRSTVLAFDREGRLYTYFRSGVTYRRTLASTVEVRYREDARRRERLLPQGAVALFAEARQAVAACLDEAPPDVRARVLEDGILEWTPERLLAQGDEFRRIYKPISILPPDQYLSIVVQATEGCTWNRCTFCSFYQDRPFRAKPAEEFARHVQEVKAFFGKGLLMRKGVFLADGNALALSQGRIEPLLEITRAAFPGEAIYSFVDVYTGERRPVEGWRRLAQLGLTRVYIGMETGLDELLVFLNKPGSREELVQFVRDLKDAGLLVGLIAMVGVGGAEYAAAHAAATLAAIAQMPLGQGDLIYLSPFIEQPGSAYVARRQEAALTPLSDEAIEAELERLAREIRAMGLKAARYDIREFIY